MTTATVTMTVGELSRRTGVPIKALRDYTDGGLIDTLGRNGANYRLYDQQALRCVHAINEMRGLGLTVAEIRWLAGRCRDEDGYPLGPTLALRLRVARERLVNEIEGRHQMLRRLDAFEAAHREALASHSAAAEIWSEKGESRDCCA